MSLCGLTRSPPRSQAWKRVSAFPISCRLPARTDGSPLRFRQITASETLRQLLVASLLSGNRAWNLRRVRGSGTVSVANSLLPPPAASLIIIVWVSPPSLGARWAQPEPSLVPTQCSCTHRFLQCAPRLADGPNTIHRSSFGEIRVALYPSTRCLQYVEPHPRAPHPELHWVSNCR